MSHSLQTYKGEIVELFDHLNLLQFVQLYHTSPITLRFYSNVRWWYYANVFLSFPTYQIDIPLHT